MLICAAMKVQVEGLDRVTIVPCIRHGDCYSILKDLGYAPKAKYKILEQGFVDNFGKFYNRQEALKYVKEIGQLPIAVTYYQEDNGIDELYSEDLY